MSNWFFYGVIALACLINSEPALAEFSTCAWPITLSPEGSGNVVLPEQTARDWLIPFETKYQRMTIKGAYPRVSYFSYVVYNDKTPSGIAGNLYDAQIAPDAGSINPFVRSQNSMGQHPSDAKYTVVISRSGTTSGNKIVVSPGVFGWVFMRNYVPSADPKLNGKSLMGGVPLPNITMTDQNGVSQQLKPCSPVNKAADLGGYLRAIFAISGTDLDVDEGTPSSDRLWFAPAIAPFFMMPNPHNKYAAMLPANYQPGRIIVIRGRAPGFPDTFHGTPIWVPAPGFRNVDMRYWSVCNNDFAWPLSLVNCASDLTTELQGGYYTIVISDDLLRPEWLRPNINWLSWGDEQYPKVVLFRKMLPSDNFQYAVQNAYDHCAFRLTFPLPDRSVIDRAGQCAEEIMGDYYPVAVWCDKSTFDHSGWQACIKRQ